MQAAWGVLDFYSHQVSSGKMTEKEAQESAKAVIAHLRYGKNNYFFISDMTPHLLIQPQAALVGKDVSDLKDRMGNCEWFIC